MPYSIKYLIYIYSQGTLALLLVQVVHVYRHLPGNQVDPGLPLNHPSLVSLEAQADPGLPLTHPSQALLVIPLPQAAQVNLGALSTPGDLVPLDDHLFLKDRLGPFFLLYHQPLDGLANPTK